MSEKPKPDRARPSMDDVLLKMLHTPPKPHAAQKKKRRKKPANK